MAYDQTLSRVETYFDKTATKTWEALTSDAPVSRIRETVRAGRDKMRALMLSRLPVDLTGQRVLDAGCGAGQMTAELAARGATVVAVDISPSLVEIAQKRLPEHHQAQVTFTSGDMLSDTLGLFDHVVAMDSLIYYTAEEIGAALATLDKRTGRTIVFTVAPRTRALMAMWYAGKLFPRSDRSPTMVPHATAPLIAATKRCGVMRPLRPVDRVKSGFYFSQAMELRG
ncbi:Magnesium-protoporphyrin O-methyltransferase [Ascidiaceihabitans donghaensis]|uniref:Magnesium protoporphyrin IX methyltransferase n=1 Tax=Ascidiaceihabitans donghaensis TaxID=1510460 RepID=A0A2R8BPB2_9RHOB|nr:magnesium protoporphyrin IX methyltransferase [Ascidiaceihabitans donghaensis]SPH27380.1 Magnesium-protoporphyrin O-methyltransferase [Ascidiaceihabitans donghaensis]